MSALRRGVLTALGHARARDISDFVARARIEGTLEAAIDADDQFRAETPPRETLCFRLRMTVKSGGRDGRTLTVTRNFESYADADNARLRSEEEIREHGGAVISASLCSEEEIREHGGAVISASLYRVVRKGGAR